MGYVTQNLLEGEEVKHTGKIHWIVYLKSVTLTLFAIIALVVSNILTSPESPDAGIIFFMFGAFALPFGLIFMAVAWVERWTTELAVTSRRVIAKIGLIRRNTIELSHKKVESIRVDQSVLGRILNYGTLTIQGTGGGNTPIENVGRPMVFRREAMELADAAD